MYLFSLSLSLSLYIYIYLKYVNYDKWYKKCSCNFNYSLWSYQRCGENPWTIQAMLLHLSRTQRRKSTGTRGLSVWIATYAIIKLLFLQFFFPLIMHLCRYDWANKLHDISCMRNLEGFTFVWLKLRINHFSYIYIYI